MNFLLFVLEILFIATVIALVPGRSELRSKPCLALSRMPLQISKRGAKRR
jgi:hypothetical protein